MFIPPIINRFDYNVYERIEGGLDGRLYSTPSGNLPSVTTILSSTDNNISLQEWRKAVGEERANNIVLEATTIGTFMHENLENRLINKEDHLGGMPVRVLARNMADVIQKEAWPKINEVWGQEISLYYPGLWAGTTDLVGIHEGVPAIMDYKNSRKIKTWDKIENYRLQIAAYALSHNELFGTNISKGVIMVCVRHDYHNLEYQEFVIEGDDFEEAKQLWIDKVETYYKNKGIL